MLERAKFLLVSEIAEAEEKPRTGVEERVERALERTFGALSAKPDPASGWSTEDLERLSLPRYPSRFP